MGRSGGTMAAEGGEDVRDSGGEKGRSRMELGISLSAGAHKIPENK